MVSLNVQFGGVISMSAIGKIRANSDSTRSILHTGYDPCDRSDEPTTRLGRELKVVCMVAPRVAGAS